jgi:hypothetical protein
MGRLKFPPCVNLHTLRRGNRMMMRTMRSRTVAIAFAVVALAAGGSHAPAFAERAPEVTVLNLRLVCDPEQCRTPVLEVHELTGAEESSVDYVFAPPPGITFDDARTTGVEVDGAGADHYVRALAGPRWLKCKWLARAESPGAAGFAKGYCWVGIKK